MIHLNLIDYHIEPLLSWDRLILLEFVVLNKALLVIFGAFLVQLRDVIESYHLLFELPSESYKNEDYINIIIALLTELAAS